MATCCRISSLTSVLVLEASSCFSAKWSSKTCQGRRMVRGIAAEPQPVTSGSTPPSAESCPLLSLHVAPTQHLRQLGFGRGRPARLYAPLRCRLGRGPANSKQQTNPDPQPHQPCCDQRQTARTCPETFSPLAQTLRNLGQVGHIRTRPDPCHHSVRKRPSQTLDHIANHERNNCISQPPQLCVQK